MRYDDLTLVNINQIFEQDLIPYAKGHTRTLLASMDDYVTQSYKGWLAFPDDATRIMRYVHRSLMVGYVVDEFTEAWEVAWDHIAELRAEYDDLKQEYEEARIDFLALGAEVKALGAVLSGVGARNAI